MREFVEASFAYVGIQIEWQGSGVSRLTRAGGIGATPLSPPGVEEIGIDKATGAVRVRVSPKYHRPAEVRAG